MSDLTMVAVCNSETSVYSETTRLYIPEDCKLHTRRRETLKSHYYYCVQTRKNLKPFWRHIKLPTLAQSVSKRRHSVWTNKTKRRSQSLLLARTGLRNEERRPPYTSSLPLFMDRVCVTKILRKLTENIQECWSPNSKFTSEISFLTSGIIFHVCSFLCVRAFVWEYAGMQLEMRTISQLGGACEQWLQIRQPLCAVLI
jgi:hypothetical protein